MTNENELVVAKSLPPAFGGAKPKSVAELRSVVTTALDAWLAKTESERTRVAYRNDVEQFLEYLGINPKAYRTHDTSFARGRDWVARFASQSRRPAGYQWINARCSKLNRCSKTHSNSLILFIPAELRISRRKSSSPALCIDSQGSRRRTNAGHSTQANDSIARCSEHGAS